MGVDPLDPLEHLGIPLARRFRNRREPDVEPTDPDQADPYTRCRFVTTNGIEAEALLSSHQFARRCTDPEVERRPAQVRYVQAQRHKAVNWLPAHARAEERSAFLHIRRRADPERPASMTLAVTAAEAMAPTRPHPGTESAATHRAPGPPAAMVDRTRDAVREALGAGG